MAAHEPTDIQKQPSTVAPNDRKEEIVVPGTAAEIEKKSLDGNMPTEELALRAVLYDDDRSRTELTKKINPYKIVDPQRLKEKSFWKEEFKELDGVLLTSLVTVALGLSVSNPRTSAHFLYKQYKVVGRKKDTYISFDVSVGLAEGCDISIRVASDPEGFLSRTSFPFGTENELRSEVNKCVEDFTGSVALTFAQV